MQKSASAQEILAKVGNTPLVRLESLSDETKEVHAKLEGHNPFGSVKDRAAYWMIREAEKEGTHQPHAPHDNRADIRQHRNRADRNRTPPRL